MSEKKKPELQLEGQDSNVFNIIGLAVRAARKAGWKPEEVEALKDRMLHAGSYDDVLCLCMDEFEVY